MHAFTNVLSRTVLTPGFWDVPIKLFRAFHAGHQRRAAIRQLHDLDDQMLRDIGLSRSEIDYAARFGRR